MDKSFEVTAPVTVTETGSAGALAASPRAALSHADVVLENRTTTNKAATDSAPGFVAGGEEDTPAAGAYSLQTLAGSLGSLGSLVGSLGSGSLGSGSIETRGALPSVPSLSHAGGSGGFSSSLAALLSHFGSNSAAATATAVPALASSIPAKLPEAASASVEGLRELGSASTGDVRSGREAEDSRVVKEESVPFQTPASLGLVSPEKHSLPGSNQRLFAGLSGDLSALAEQDRLQWAQEVKPSVKSASTPSLGRAALSSTGQAADSRSGSEGQLRPAEAAKGEGKEAEGRTMDHQVTEDKGQQAGAQAAVAPASAGLNRMTSADLGLAKQSSLQSADFSTVSDFTLFPGTGSGSLRGLVSSGSGAGGLFRGESLLGALNPPLLRAESYEFSFFGPFGSASLEDAVRPLHAREGGGEDAQHRMTLLQQQHQLLQQHHVLQQQQQKQGGEGTQAQQERQEQAEDGRNGAAAPGDAEGQRPGGASTKQGEEQGALSLNHKAGEALGGGGRAKEKGAGAEEEEACNMLPSAGLSITTERPGSPLLALGMRTAPSPKLSVDASGTGTGTGLASGSQEQGAPPGSPRDALKRLLQEHQSQQGAGAAAARRAQSPQVPSQLAQAEQGGEQGLGAEGYIERLDSGTIEAIIRPTQRPGVGGTGTPEGEPGAGQHAGGQGQSSSGASGDAPGAGGGIPVRPGGLLEELRAAGVSMGEEKFAAALGSLPLAAELLQAGSNPGSKPVAGINVLQRMRSPSPNVSGATRDMGRDTSPRLPVASRLAAPTSSGATPSVSGQAGSAGSARRPYASPPPSSPRAVAGADAEGVRGMDAAARLQQLEQQQLLQLLPLLSQQMQVQQQMQQQVQQGQQSQAQGQQQQQQHLASQLLSNQLRQQGLAGLGQAPGGQGQSPHDLPRLSPQTQREQLLMLLQQHQQQQAKRVGPASSREQRMQSPPPLGSTLAAMQGLGDAVGTPTSAAASLGPGRQDPTLNLLPNGLSAPAQAAQPSSSQLSHPTPPQSPGPSSQLGAGTLKGDSASLLELLGQGATYLGGEAGSHAQKGVASAAAAASGLNLPGVQLAAMAKGAMGGSVMDAAGASGAQHILHLLHQQHEKERLLKQFPSLLLQQQGQVGQGLAGGGPGAAQQLNLLLQQQMQREAQQKQKGDVQQQQQQQLLLLHQLQQQQLSALGAPKADLAQDQQQSSLHSRGLSSGDGDTLQGPQKKRRKPQQEHDGVAAEQGRQQGGGGTPVAGGLLAQKAQREAQRAKTPPPEPSPQQGPATRPAAMKQEQVGVETPLSRSPLDAARIRESLGLPARGPAAARAAAALLATSLKDAESSGGEEMEEEEEEVEKVPGKPGPRRKRGPVTKPCAAARKRRDCISRHIKTLQGMIPAAPKSDAATVLAETITYIAQLLDENEALRHALAQREQGGAGQLDGDGKGGVSAGGEGESGGRGHSDSLEGAALGKGAAVVTGGPDTVTASGASGGS